jgi:hypothetical protein
MAKNAQKLSSNGNSGIQATSVVADVLAVGANSKASKTVRYSTEAKRLDQTIGELKGAISKAKIPADISQKIKGEMNNLSEIAKAPKKRNKDAQQPLQNIAAHLKEAGQVVAQASVLGQALEHLARHFGFAWSLFSGSA